MAVTIPSVVIDDGGEQVIVTLAGVAAPLAAPAPSFVFHRSSGENLVQDQVVVNNDTKITINGLKKQAGGAVSRIRGGEVVTMDYVSGLTGNAIAIPAINGVVCTNNSERQPFVDAGGVGRINHNYPSKANLSGLRDGHVRIYNATSYDAGTRSMLASSPIHNGRWDRDVELATGTTYVFEFYDTHNVQYDAKRV